MKESVYLYSTKKRLMNLRNGIFSCTLIASSILFTACSSEATKTTETDTATEKTEQESEESSKEEPTIQAEVTPVKSVKLSSKYLGELDYGVPQYQVLLTVDGKKQILDTVAACTPIPASNFKQYEIPADAKSACGGWFAGGGDYFYATITDGKAVVFQGWQDEGQEDDGYHWKERK
jgi:hypothetical protein